MSDWDGLSALCQAIRKARALLLKWPKCAFSVQVSTPCGQGARNSFLSTSATSRSEDESLESGLVGAQQQPQLKDWNAVLATLLQTRRQLSQTCQQLRQLRQRVKEQREKEQVRSSSQGTECRAVKRALNAGPGSEEARAASENRVC